MSDPCPACPSRVAPVSVETHHDRVGDKVYRILRCADCGVVFSEPREPVGPEWYEKASPIRGLQACPPASMDWRYRRFFEEGLSPGRLLDIGCGDGGFLSLAKARGFSVAGFDYERRMIELAHRRGIEDAEASEFGEWCRRRPGNEFDVVTLFDVLEHVPEPGWFLGEVRRLLKPGGHVVITLPNALRPLPFRREDHDYPPHHFTRWTPTAMRGFLQRRHFRVVSQDCTHLRVGYLSDHLFFYVFMPWLLASARRILFGRASGNISELYAQAGPPGHNGSGSPVGWRARLRTVFSDKLARQKFVDAFKRVCSVFLYPSAVLLTIFYRTRRPDCGDCLYTAARLEIE